MTDVLVGVSMALILFNVLVLGLLWGAQDHFDVTVNVTGPEGQPLGKIHVARVWYWKWRPTKSPIIRIEDRREYVHGKRIEG